MQEVGAHLNTNPHTQNQYQIRFDWGLQGLKNLQPEADTVVIIDILSFTTCVTIACERGAKVYPFLWNDEKAEGFAKENGAILAKKRGKEGELTLSPTSLLKVKNNTKLVLPSPNGSTLTTQAKEEKTVACGFRNFSAVARYLNNLNAESILIIASGEKWEHTGELRPSLEDYLGAGALISKLNGSKSPEAMLAEISYIGAKGNLKELVLNSASGRELIQRGFKSDVEEALKVDVTECVPVYRDGFYAI